MLPNFKRSESEPPKVTPSLPPSPPQSNSLSARTLGIARSGERSTASVIGPDLTINGNLVSKGEVQVDGGINQETAKLVLDAGADLLVAGTATFTGGPGAYADNIRRLRCGR